MMCGYGVPKSDLAHYLCSPSNSLTVWGDQGDINIAADYGAAALFMIYMADHFGGAALISHLLRNQITGEAGITAALAELGHWQWTFPMVFKAWRLTNLIRAETPGSGLYNYISIDLDDIQPLTINRYAPKSGMVSRSAFLGPTYSLEGYDTGVDTVAAYSVDYYSVDAFGSLSKIDHRVVFEGANEADQSVPTSDGNVDFSVTMYFPATSRLTARITDVPIYHASETGMRYLAWFAGYTEAYILISPNEGPVDYQFGVVQ
ncbi:MAG: hypothetical protein WCK39_05405 [Methanomassiliicoccales archaeon]